MARPKKSDITETDTNSTKKKTGKNTVEQKNTTQKTSAQNISTSKASETSKVSKTPKASKSPETLETLKVSGTSESSIIITIDETDKNINNIFNNNTTEFNNDMLADTITATKKSTTIELASNPAIESEKRRFKETGSLIDLVNKEKRK